MAATSPSFSLLSDTLLTMKASCSQFESLAGFSAVIDRLGEFSEVVGSYTPAEPATDGAAGAADAGADHPVAAAQSVENASAKRLRYLLSGKFMSLQAVRFMCGPWTLCSVPRQRCMCCLRPSSALRSACDKQMGHMADLQELQQKSWPNCVAFTLDTHMA